MPAIDMSPAVSDLRQLAGALRGGSAFRNLQSEVANSSGAEGELARKLLGKIHAQLDQIALQNAYEPGGGASELHARCKAITENAKVLSALSKSPQASALAPLGGFVDAFLLELKDFKDLIGQASVRKGAAGATSTTLGDVFNDLDHANLAAKRLAPSSSAPQPLLVDRVLARLAPPFATEREFLIAARAKRSANGITQDQLSEIEQALGMILNGRQGCAAIFGHRRITVQHVKELCGALSLIKDGKKAISTALNLGSSAPSGAPGSRDPFESRVQRTLKDLSDLSETPGHLKLRTFAADVAVHSALRESRGEGVVFPLAESRYVKLSDYLCRATDACLQNPGGRVSYANLTPSDIRSEVGLAENGPPREVERALEILRDRREEIQRLIKEPSLLCLSTFALQLGQLCDAERPNQHSAWAPLVAPLSNVAADFSKLAKVDLAAPVLSDKSGVAELRGLYDVLGRLDRDLTSLKSISSLGADQVTLLEECQKTLGAAKALFDTWLPMTVDQQRPLVAGRMAKEWITQAGLAGHEEAEQFTRSIAQALLQYPSRDLPEVPQFDRRALQALDRAFEAEMKRIEESILSTPSAAGTAALREKVLPGAQTGAVEGAAVEHFAVTARGKFNVTVTRDSAKYIVEVSEPKATRGLFKRVLNIGEDKDPPKVMFEVIDPEPSGVPMEYSKLKRGIEELLTSGDNIKTLFAPAGGFLDSSGLEKLDTSISVEGSSLQFTRLERIDLSYCKIKGSPGEPEGKYQGLTISECKSGWGNAALTVTDQGLRGVVVENSEIGLFQKDGSLDLTGAHFEGGKVFGFIVRGKVERANFNCEFDLIAETTDFSAAQFPAVTMAGSKPQLIAEARSKYVGLNFGKHLCPGLEEIGLVPTKNPVIKDAKHV